MPSIGAPGQTGARARRRVSGVRVAARGMPFAEGMGCDAVRGSGVVRVLGSCRVRLQWEVCVRVDQHPRK